MAWYAELPVWMRDRVEVTDDAQVHASAALMDKLGSPELPAFLGLPALADLRAQPEALSDWARSMTWPLQSSGERMGELRSACARRDWLGALWWLSSSPAGSPEAAYVLDMIEDPWLEHALVLGALFEDHRGLVRAGAELLRRLDGMYKGSSSWQGWACWNYVSARCPPGPARVRVLELIAHLWPEDVFCIEGPCVWVREEPGGGVCGPRRSFHRLGPNPEDTLPPYPSFAHAFAREPLAALASVTELTLAPDGSLRVLGPLEPRDAHYSSGDGITRATSEVDVLWEPTRGTFWVYATDPVSR